MKSLIPGLILAITGVSWLIADISWERYKNRMLDVKVIDEKDPHVRKIGSFDKITK
jgi:hypothetical protein